VEHGRTKASEELAKAYDDAFSPSDDPTHLQRLRAEAAAGNNVGRGELPLLGEMAEEIGVLDLESTQERPEGQTKAGAGPTAAPEALPQSLPTVSKPSSRLPSENLGWIGDFHDRHPWVFSAVAGAFVVGVIAVIATFVIYMYHSKLTSGASPKIRSVSSIGVHDQSFTISGKGFGSQPPFHGDRPCLGISDVTAGWTAGFVDPASHPPNNSGGPCSAPPAPPPAGDTITVAVSSWTDSRIEVDGLAGSYAYDGWVLHAGDELRIQVWNAQSGRGPASFTLIATG
jgi:hypothetical protein